MAKVDDDGPDYGGRGRGRKNEVRVKLRLRGNENGRRDCLHSNTATMRRKTAAMMREG